MATKSNSFMKSVFDMGKSFDRIGVTFDRYRKDSMKSGARKKPTQWQHAHKKSNRKQINLSSRHVVLLHYTVEKKEI